jgi:4-hydroxybenzoate polyprenyltransferase
MLADFVRLSAVGVTLSLVLLGAVSGGGSISAAGAGVVLVIAAMFHVTVYVLNDAIDRDLDRTEPRRAGFPLVTGAIPVPVALGVAFGLIPLAVAVDVAWFGPSAGQLAALLGAYAGLVTYDLAGKRCPWPPATDLVQGLGWAALVAFGACANGPATLPTLLTGAYVTAYIMLVNGVHGAIRDLVNDLRHGARTTAIAFGARPSNGGTLLSRALRRYGWGLQGALVGIALLSLPWAVRQGWAAEAVAVTTIGLSLISCALFVRALAAAGDVLRMRVVGAAHLVVSFVPAAGLASLNRGPIWLAAGALVMALPLVANPWVRANLSRRP